MKNLKCCYVALVASAMALTAVAQTGSGSANKSATTGPITMQGCINGGPHGYTFIQTSTGTAFALQGASGKFDPYRGKLVNVTGKEAPPTALEGTKDMPQFAPAEVKSIGDCPLNTAGRSDRPSGAPLTAPPMTTGNAPQQQNAPAASTPEYASPGAPNQKPPSVGNNPNQPGASGAPSPGTGNPPTTPPSR